MTEQISNLHSTPSANRIHIGFFGCRNAGKSSLINALTNQECSLVSDIKGTTLVRFPTAMELLPLGPVVIIDTPGFDDEGELGSLRVKRTQQVLNRVDLAILVVDGSVGENEFDKELWTLIQKRNIPALKVFNKSDLNDSYQGICVSAKNKEGLEQY